MGRRGVCTAAVTPRGGIKRREVSYWETSCISKRHDEPSCGREREGVGMLERQVTGVSRKSGARKKVIGYQAQGWCMKLRGHTGAWRGQERKEGPTGNYGSVDPAALDLVVGQGGC